MATGKLLIVNDAIPQTEALCDILGPAGYTSTCLPSTEAALAVLRVQQFDLVLTDLMTPEMGGVAFLQAAFEIDSDLVAIVLTEPGMTDVAEQAMQLGALDYIVKPFDRRTILWVVARALRERQLRLENLHLKQAVGVYELSMVIRLTLGFEDVLQKIADAAMGHSEIGGVSVLLPIDDGKALQVAVGQGENAMRDKGKRIPFTPALSDWTEGHLNRLFHPTESADARTALGLDLPEMPSGAFVPMLAGGRLVGILNFTSKNPARPVSASLIKALNILATAGASALEAASLLDQLRLSEERARSLSESATDIVFRYELEPVPRFTYVNPAVASILGYSPEEHYADPDLIRNLVHPDDRELIEPVLCGGVSSGSTVTLRYLHRNGDSIWIELRTALVRDPDGRLIAIEGIGRDITRRRHLEEQLRQSQKMEAVGLLAGGVAHDFNSLLTVIIGYSDLILIDDEPSAQIVEKIDQVRKAAERASALTKQLLAFGRRQIARPTALNVNSVVGSISKTLRRIIGEDIEIVTRLDSELRLVKADAGQIEQILVDLVNNARSAMPAGGRITIETKNVTLDEAPAAGIMTGNAGPYVMLAVSDTGLGMDAATQARVFEPFFTTKEPGKGTGLGLSVVYGIVKQSAGHVRLFSEPGKGTRLEILLPRIEQLEQAPEPAAVPAEPPLASKTIMLVEDDAAVCKLITAYLKRGGYGVLIAHNGNEALRMYEQHEGEIALILTDVIMPGMSGPTLVESLAFLNRGTRVLYMSGHVGNAAVDPGQLDPRIPLIQKPFTVASLLSKIRETLDPGARGEAAIGNTS